MGKLKSVPLETAFDFVLVALGIVVTPVSIPCWGRRFTLKGEEPG